MKLEKSSWEEVIRIQSSYRIIKRDYVSPRTEGSSFIETKIDYDPKEVDEIDQLVVSKENPEDLERKLRDKVLRDLEKEKEAIIQKAMEDGEEIRNRARDTGYKEGYEKGLEDGSKQGLEEGTRKGLENGYLQGLINAKDEANEIKESALNVLHQAQEEVDKYFAKNEEKLIKLAGLMAEAIVHKSIDTSSENIMQLIRPIIHQFRKVESVIISCHPDNYDFVREELYLLEEKYEDVKFSLFEDDSLEKNGCIVENENQIVDLQIGKQIKNIMEKMAKME